ncbi:MAG: metalloregulator ArsR/SmtB family transcription factor [Anaerolineales bacterium]
MTNIDSFDALADPTRRQLIEMLRQGPHSVNELAEALPVSQPAVSQHLKVLKRAHLVKSRKQGNQRIYTINADGLAELRDYVEGLWQDVLTAFQEAADAQAQED